MLFSPIAPEGRLGPATPDFAAQQLQTLRGQSGPNSSTFDQRRQWFHDVLQIVGVESHGWLTGVGLGPDLAGGFRSASGAEVRKPHNDYLEIFARLGLPALLVFAAFLFSALIQVAKSARLATGTEARFLSWVLGTATVYLLIAATQPLLAFPYGTIPLFMTLGAGLSLVRNMTPEVRRGS